MSSTPKKKFIFLCDMGKRQAPYLLGFNSIDISEILYVESIFHWIGLTPIQYVECNRDVVTAIF